MIAPILIMLSAVAPAPATQPPVALADIDEAIRAGRLEQAQLMVGRAIGAGAKGTQVDVILAELAYAQDKNEEALARYCALLKVAPDDASLSERAGIAALKLGKIADAVPLLDRSTKSVGVTWRAWNARGVAADLQQDWNTADLAYAQAAALAPDEAEVVNNEGWSQLLRGDWRKAADLFADASAKAPHSERIANNLELARSALASDLPRRQQGEDNSEWAARLNDAGVAAQLLGDKQRAVAAFAQALEARGSWYDRAANNLRAANGR
jgi:tetratricopeptide (TPR) repeat protein